MKLPPKIASKILKSTTEAIVVVDASGKIVFVNKQAERLFGYARKRDPVGDDIEVLMPAAVRHAHAAHRHGYRGSPHQVDR